jgi:hypothetical protein
VIFPVVCTHLARVVGVAGEVRHVWQLIALPCDQMVWFAKTFEVIYFMIWLAILPAIESFAYSRWRWVCKIVRGWRNEDVASRKS